MLNKTLWDFAEINKKHLGMVSIDIPLISNLDVWGNIALIKQYHQNVSREEAQHLVFDYLQRYDMTEIAYKRNPALTRERTLLCYAFKGGNGDRCRRCN